MLLKCVVMDFPSSLVWADHHWNFNFDRSHPLMSDWSFCTEWQNNKNRSHSALLRQCSTSPSCTSAHEHANAPAPKGTSASTFQSASLWWRCSESPPAVTPDQALEIRYAEPRITTHFSALCSEYQHLHHHHHHLLLPPPSHRRGSCTPTSHMFTHTLSGAPLHGDCFVCRRV